MKHRARTRTSLENPGAHRREFMMKIPVNCWNSLRDQTATTWPATASVKAKKRLILADQHPSGSGMSRRINEQGCTSRPEGSPTKAGNVLPVSFKNLDFSMKMDSATSIKPNKNVPTCQDIKMCSGLMGNHKKAG